MPEGYGRGSTAAVLPGDDGVGGPGAGAGSGHPGDVGVKMITNRGFHPCSSCETRKSEAPGRRTLGTLTAIGQAVTSPSRSSSTYTYYQCAQCGELWVHLEDAGQGGHATFVYPMRQA